MQPSPTFKVDPDQEQGTFPFQTFAAGYYTAGKGWGGYSECES